MTLEEIDLELTKQFELLNKVIDETLLKQICQFNLNEHLNEIPWGELKYSGIYLFEIKNNGKFSSFEDWINDFKIGWRDTKYLKQFTPDLKEIRIKSHTELNEWIPLYIGKSRNIEARIHEHIFKEIDKTTFALKLLARTNLHNDSFRLSTLKMDVSNYDAIVSRVEWQLRNKINPIAGKQ